MVSTTRNMWKVVCDRKCGAIVMLSDLMENKKVDEAHMESKYNITIYTSLS